MPQLNTKNLKNSISDLTDREQTITSGNYDRAQIQPGIVHFGVGNFHRCHQAVYIDKLLNQGVKDWGIIGISMRSTKIRDALQSQNFLYTEVTLGKQSSFRIIGSILDILVAPENPTAVISQVAKNQIKLVTTTITEKGYYLCSGQIDQSDPDIVADKTCLENPRTIYGYLAASIIQRGIQDAAPLSIICCDNIQAGGEHLRAGVYMLLQQHAQHLLSWVEKHVSFASSMVDRVSPATDDNLKSLVHSTVKLKDVWPVSAEPFSQWVIENKFAGPKPALDKVGAIFADDISYHQQMKLRFLNAGHSIIAVLAYLAGHKTIHQALEQPYILQFVQRALCENILPVTEIPQGYQGKDYIAEVIQRFQNSALPYFAQQVNSDSSQKIILRWFPSIDNALLRNTDTAFMSFILAAWVVYVERALDANELNDPLDHHLMKANQNDGQRVEQFLTIIGASHFNFAASAPFMTDVTNAYQTLKDINISNALSDFLTKNTSQPKELDHA